MTTTLSREDLFTHYDRCLAEYRFQIELNWKRAQYFFALNTAVPAAGLGLLANAAPADAEVLVALFVVGIGLAVFSVVTTRIQHGYYSSARDLVKKVEGNLPLEDLAIRTTPGMGSPIPRWRRVHDLQELMFLLLGLVDVAGVIAAIN